MVDIHWQTNGKYEELYVGCLDFHLAWIHPSKSGKLWGFFFQIPIDNGKWKTYMPKEELKAAIEKAVDHWFGMANTDRPAMDRPDVC